VRDFLAVFRNGVAERLEMGQGLGEVGGLAVLVEVLEVGAQRGGALGKNAVQGGPLVVGGGLPFLDGDGARAGTRPRTRPGRRR
jgi:hypothetical protein